MYASSRGAPHRLLKLSPDVSWFCAPVIGVTRDYESGDFLALAMSFPIARSSHSQLDMLMVLSATITEDQLVICI